MSELGSRVSDSVTAMTVSAIKEMAFLARAYDDVAQLTWGLPSFRTPPSIREALTSALAADPDIGKYAMPDGLPDLRASAAAAHAAATGQEADPDREVLIGAGNIEAMNVLLHVLLDPGDEVILTDPGFASHVQQIRLCGGRPIFWPLDENRGWQLDPSSLETRITPRTKAIILISPNNPTGTVFREAELRETGRIAARHGVLLLLDNAYFNFCLEHRDAWFSLASVPELKEHVASLYSFSKGYAMSGFRVGYMVVPEWLRREALKVHDATLICAPRPSQVAAQAALRLVSGHLTDFEATIRRRRELICRRLDRLPHVFGYRRPEGAYYMFPKILVEHETSRAFCLDVLHTARVTLTPGSAFGPSGEHHVRMAFCIDDAVIETAFDRLESRFA